MQPPQQDTEWEAELTNLLDLAWSESLSETDMVTLFTEKPEGRDLLVKEDFLKVAFDHDDWLEEEIVSLIKFGLENHLI